jgi:hypothetical protein
MKNSLPLIPLWALVLGPIWIPILLVWFFIYSIFAVAWLIPSIVACEVFGWKMPDGVMPNWFDDDQYEMMP